MYVIINTTIINIDGIEYSYDNINWSTLYSQTTGIFLTTPGCYYRTYHYKNITNGSSNFYLTINK